MSLLVSHVATNAPLVTLSEHASLVDALAILRAHKIRCVSKRQAQVRLLSPQKKHACFLFLCVFSVEIFFSCFRRDCETMTIFATLKPSST
jgi:hypothetical protein